MKVDAQHRILPPNIRVRSKRDRQFQEEDLSMLKNVRQPWSEHYPFPTDLMLMTCQIGVSHTMDHHVYTHDFFQNLNRLQTPHRHWTYVCWERSQGSSETIVPPQCFAWH